MGPKAREPESAATGQGHGIGGASLHRRGRKRILIVDDQPAVRELVAMTLGEADFELFNAGDGLEALQLARSTHPDLVLLDIGMPKLDGLTVCRMLKEDPETRDVRVIMLTAAGSDTDRQTALRLGADEYFTKPFSPTRLKQRICELVGL